MATTDLAEQHRRLRAWVADRFSGDNPSRYAAYFQAISASYIRSLRFGLEENLQGSTSRDLLQLQFLVNDKESAVYARITATRAIVEEEEEILRFLLDLPVLDAVRNWYAGLLDLDREAAADAIDGTGDDEERAVTRLVLGRRFPDLVHLSWIAESADLFACIPNALCRLVAERRVDLHDALLDFLGGHHAILLADDPDRILAPIVAQHPLPPQAVLDRWQDYYGERTICAAAEWHLEHAEPRSAITLADRVRCLSTWFPRSCLLRCLACIDLDMRNKARQQLAGIFDPALVRIAAVRLAERGPEWLSDEDLIGSLENCDANQAETLHMGLLVLLRRRRLTEARRLVDLHARRFAGHPVLTPVFENILGTGTVDG